MLTDFNEKLKQKSMYSLKKTIVCASEQYFRQTNKIKHECQLDLLLYIQAGYLFLPFYIPLDDDIER